jgi:hypothetical protein
MEKRRLEEEARRRAAEQKRAKELEARRAAEEEARRQQEAARRQAAMDAVRGKRPQPAISDKIKYMTRPIQGPFPPPPGSGTQPLIPRPFRVVVEGGPVISLKYAATGKPYPGK